MDKSTLRTRLTAARRTRSADDIEGARSAVCEHVLAEVDRSSPACVAGYEPLRTEPGSLRLLAGLHARGVRVLVPVMLPDRDLDWREWRPDGRGTPQGVAAIAAADLILVPALAVGADGMRLGRGGGSYDRALARVAVGTRTAALLYDDEVCDSVPAEPWDRAVGWAVTPSGGWQRLGGNTAQARND